jgi:hypothetical protein
MRVAFKEWAIVVDALGRGEQIVILRKGGISEGRHGFALDHPQFLLFPTLFHQQRESVLPQAQARFDQIAPHFPDQSRLQIEFFAEVIGWKRIETLVDAERLRGQHIWRDEVIAQRFEWTKSKNIHALAVRVFRLPQVLELPMSPRYGGCKSWIELEEEISTAGAKAVLNQAEFDERLKMFYRALELAPMPG